MTETTLRRPAQTTTRAVASLLCGLLALGPGAQALAAPGAKKTRPPLRVLAVPFVALPGAPETGAGRLWAQVLAELRTRPELTISEPPADGGDLPFSAARATAEAEKAVVQAREQVARSAELGRKNKPAQQASALLKAVTLLLGKPLAVDQQGGALLADATQQMAAARMQSGNDEGGDEALADLVRRAPERSPAGDYPPAFVRAYEAARQRVLSGPRGSLRVLAPAGAACQVLLDGRPLGSTPVQLVEVPTGVHAIRVERPGEAWAETVTLLAGAELLVRPRPGGFAGGPTSELQAELGRGQLDRPAAAKAAKLARSAGAQAALIGAISREHDGLAARSFLVLAKSEQVVPLSAMALDAEMLGASLEVLRLADDLVARLLTPPAESPLPVPLGSASAEALEMPSVAAAPPAPEGTAAPVDVLAADLRKAAGVSASAAPAATTADSRPAATTAAPDPVRSLAGSLAAAVAAAAPSTVTPARVQQPQEPKTAPAPALAAAAQPVAVPAQPEAVPAQPEAVPAPGSRVALIPGAKPAAVLAAAPAPAKAPVAIEESKEQAAPAARSVAIPAESRAAAVPPAAPAAPAPLAPLAAAGPSPSRELVIPLRPTRDDRDDEAGATSARSRPAPLTATRMEAREASEVGQVREQPASKSHTALWIVAGVLVAGGLGTGGYFLYQGSRSASSATVNASWSH